jgi:outer membrane biosynthesis protein TonB
LISTTCPRRVIRKQNNPNSRLCPNRRPLPTRNQRPQPWIRHQNSRFLLPLPHRFLHRNLGHGLSVQPPKQPVPSHPNPAATPGGNRGLANGVSSGTGKGGSRSGLFLAQPKPPYPSAAREMQITGHVTVTLTISSGRIVAAHGNGPAILASAAASWIRANWVPAPSTSDTYELPITFRLN